MSSKWEVVTFDQRMASLYQNVIYGKPNCWDTVSKHETLIEALDAVIRVKGDKGVREIGETFGAKYRNSFATEARTIAHEILRQLPNVTENKMVQIISHVQYDISYDNYDLYYAPVSQKVKHFLK